MAEELADLFVTIRADFGGLEAALRSTRSQLESLGATGGLLGKLPGDTQKQAAQIITGVQAALAPFPAALRAGIEVPIASLLIGLEGLVTARLNGIVQQINTTLSRINSLMATLPGASATAGPASGAIAGARAAGGPVSGGQSYLVGERGPELFVPQASGQIIPNVALAGGAGLSIRGGTFHIYGVQDVEALYEQLQQVAERRR